MYDQVMNWTVRGIFLIEFGMAGYIIFVML